MKKLPVRHSSAYRQKKSTGIVANTVANVIDALLTSGEGKDRSFNKIMEKMYRDSVFRYFIECREVAFDDAKNVWGRFLVRSVQARGE